MTNSLLRPLPGSARAMLPNSEIIAALPPGETVEFTVVLRRRAALPDALVSGPDTVTPDELADRYGADPAELALVASTLRAAGGVVLAEDAPSRLVRATADQAVVQALFGVQLFRARARDARGEFEYRARSGELAIPAALAGIVIAVLGLDNRPQVRRYPTTATVAPETSYTPPQLATIYDFPAADGTGITAAILEFGGKVNTDDIAGYFHELGIAAPSVTSVSVDGVSQVSDPDIDVEVMLDVEVLGAVVPKASLLVYFSNYSDQGFVDAVSAAVHAEPTPAVISISWGNAEVMWTEQGMRAVDAAFADAAALGVTVCVASGDWGSYCQIADGGEHVAYPASSPHVLAVGGTTLHADPKTGVVQSETVWNSGLRGVQYVATGGGVSSVFDLPAWQAHVAVPHRPGQTRPGRGVPDVAAVADETTGYRIRVAGADTSIGGTSGSAPLWAGLLGRYAQLLDTKFGLLQPAIYHDATAHREAPGFRGITTGDNGGYHAGPGWNPCTGLGVPRGEALLAVLRKYLAHSRR